MRPPPRSTHFPYTTLFRSREEIGTSDHNYKIITNAYIDSLKLLYGQDLVITIEDNRPREQRANKRNYHTGFDPYTQRSPWRDRKSTRLNSSHGYISYAAFC